MGTREEFEKLLVISNILEDRGVYWSAINDKYESCHKWETYFVGYLNGAWYAFQEQQKKIDICESLRDSQFNKLWNLTQAIERARVGADEDFDLFLNHLSNTLKGE